MSKQTGAVMDFQQECVALGAACAQARMRLDERGPEPYRKAFATFRGGRTNQPYFVRKWLSLRLSAVKRGMVVDSTVTPEFLGRITDGRCPVTLEVLDIQGRSPQNPSIDRLVNEVTYIAGNICVLSMRANRAKGEMTFEQVAHMAQTGDVQAGLEPVEWMRLASLMYGAWSRAVAKSDPHLLPLAAIPGTGMFMSTSQVVQWLLTRHASTEASEGNATQQWLALTKQCGAPVSLFDEFFDALRDSLAMEAYPGNAWLHSDVFEAFVNWYNRCHGAIVPNVEALLKEHQFRLNDPVATLTWSVGGRYAN